MSSNTYERNYPSRAPQMVTHVDAHFYQLLHQNIGRMIVAQTIKDTVRGTLKHVTPDYIMIEKEGYQFFVRIQQIIWVKPGKE